MPAIDSIGPDQTDIRLCRPYYVLPIAPEAWDKAPGPTPAEQDKAVARIRDGILKAPAPITDVYILSHGWHRNFYGAISTYDRLLSRMTRLLFRGRVTPPDANYNPLFICVHWKSEVGDDIWVDFAGRRHRDDFKELALERFTASGAAFENFLDEAFVLFSEYSAPDGGDHSIHAAKATAHLLALGQTFPLQNEPAALPPGAKESQRSQALWSCYHEALAKGVRGPQTTNPSAFAPGGLRLMILSKFLLGVVPILTVIGLILGEKPKEWWDALKTWVHDSPILTPPSNPATFEAPASWNDYAETPVDWIGTQIPIAIRWAEVWLGLTLICGVIFWLSCWWSRTHKRDGRPSGVGWVTLLTWIPIQLTFAAPVLIALLFQYLAFFLPILRRFQFSERTRRAPGPQATISGPLATWARVPSLFLLESMSANNAGRAIVTAADSQLAFFFMQRRGVESGRKVAQVYLDLVRDKDTGPLIEKARLYLAGHSFGGLVVANTARSYYQIQRAEWIANNPALPPAQFRPKHAVHSLTFIEGALASGWFKIEHHPVYNITHRLSSIYSGADSATGFYYPVANGGRMANGSVGLCDVPGVKFRDPVLKAATEPCAPGCMTQHIHKAPIFAVLDNPPALPTSPVGPTVTNFDGSKMIYEGPVATGGGHTDIYKDDVTYLLWAALHG